MPIPLNPNPILPLRCRLARITLQVSHRACLSRRAHIRLGYPSVSERIRVVELAKLRLPRALGAEPRRTARRGGARDGLVVCAEDAAKGGLHDGQAGVDHAERGLKVGPDGQLGEIVSDVQHVELDGRDDAKDGDDADTVSSKDLCVRNQGDNIGQMACGETGRREDSTYMVPRPKMPLRATLRFVAICRRQRMGIGRTMMVRSTQTLTTLMPMTILNESPQVPARRGSQLLAKGRQMRNWVMIKLSMKLATTTIMTYATLRRLRVVKTWT